MLQSPLPPASAVFNALPHWKEFSKHCLVNRFKNGGGGVCVNLTDEVSGLFLGLGFVFFFFLNMVVAALCLPFNYLFKHGDVGKFITICLFSHRLPGALTTRIFQFGNSKPHSKQFRLSHFLLKCQPTNRAVVAPCHFWCPLRGQGWKGVSTPAARRL